ncbi:acyl carrier protein [Actinoalloteichus hoggarensis]|uniref:Surfactin synthase subunit 1 n=1 Tax=Actinoalloteichus hoggarensis TaxID=1470176 RepID=A0A221W5C6_9PSEU|nr:phosphopantetheine-binding protein [Actinoalloteichus hoggarensis]ASO20924.1 Surfactin synthase subunit 1 [Actinoalloteichus hoggarensis]MBB5920854.1 acyl carrier protein [Actinoalloteichus hoggarensis]
MSGEGVEESRATEIAHRVGAIWRDVLGADTQATFFELSGQSISAVRIAARIEDELGITVDIGELFEDPTGEAFARAVAARAAEAPSDRQH